jgi:hypothetical protein
MEKRSQWKFDSADGAWGWTVTNPDGSTGASDRRWPTLKDCVDDATAHGYIAWRPEEERRREHRLKVTEVLKRDG